jgi:hypothetical protein
MRMGEQAGKIIGGNMQGWERETGRDENGGQAGMIKGYRQG